MSTTVSWGGGGGGSEGEGGRKGEGEGGGGGRGRREGEEGEGEEGGRGGRGRGRRERERGDGEGGIQVYTCIYIFCCLMNIGGTHIDTIIMKGTKVQTLGARAVAGVCMVHGWLLGP